MHSTQGSYGFFLLGSKAALQTPTKLKPYLKCIACTELVTSDLALCHALILIFELIVQHLKEYLKTNPCQQVLSALLLHSKIDNLVDPGKLNPDLTSGQYDSKLWLVGTRSPLEWLSFYFRPVTKLRKRLCPRMASLVLCNCFKIKTTWKKKGIISYEGVKKLMSDEVILLKMTLIWALLYF